MGRAWRAGNTQRGTIINKGGDKEIQEPVEETLDNGDGGGRWEGGTSRSMTRETLRSGRSGV